jgi:hypothetical protein
MAWWVLELILAGILVVIVLVLGPFIKRFGRSYAADVFRANPRTGKSYMVLMDIAYYLIFTAFILFTTTFERPDDWGETVTAAQMETVLIRLGGMLLIMGVLHGLNVLSLPIVGRLLGLGRDLAALGTSPSPARPDGHSRVAPRDGDDGGTGDAAGGPSATGAP